jgi:uroporphyrinogen III methyltransferase/synthase
MSDDGKRRGRVILLGAGPGDPDLITLRGLKALQSADAVVYDALASAELLEHVSPNATLHNVGKRGHDEPTRTQPETTALLIELASAGDVVVRLKGGDPFVFGRGGEEATACVAAGIDFEVIPGISSSVAALAYAGIPITDRRLAASFAVVTGHKDPTAVSDETRWSELATAVDTLVILMGMRKLEDLVARLIDGGRDPKTPAAVIMNGTLPSQRVVTAPLCEIAERSRAAGLGAPAAVVVGDVVRLRETLNWFENRPLFGKRVLVTRDERPGGRLSSALRDAGAEPVLAPMIHVVGATNWQPVDAALASLADYDGLLITSAHAIRFLAARAEANGVSLAESGIPVYCVGPETAHVTREAGIPVSAIPDGRHDAEALLDTLVRRFAPSGRRFLFPCADDARATLPTGLTAAGASVDSVVVYHTLPAEQSASELKALLDETGVEILTFTSPSAARNFAERLDDDAATLAAGCLIGAIGPVTAEALRGVGLPADVVAERAGVQELVDSLVARVEAEAGGSR